MTSSLEVRSHDTATEVTAAARRDEDLDRPDRVFSYHELARLDEALTMSSKETGLFFNLYVGDLGKRTRSRAEELHARSTADPSDSVLIAISPGQRVVEVVTGAASSRRVPDRACAL